MHRVGSERYRASQAALIEDYNTATQSASLLMRGNESAQQQSPPVFSTENNNLDIARLSVRDSKFSGTTSHSPVARPSSPAVRAAHARHTALLERSNSIMNRSSSGPRKSTISSMRKSVATSSSNGGIIPGGGTPSSRKNTPYFNRKLLISNSRGDYFF